MKREALVYLYLANQIKYCLNQIWMLCYKLCICTQGYNLNYPKSPVLNSNISSQCVCSRAELSKHYTNIRFSVRFYPVLPTFLSSQNQWHFSFSILQVKHRFTQGRFVCISNVIVAGKALNEVLGHIIMSPSCSDVEDSVASGWMTSGKISTTLQERNRFG